MQPIKWPDFQFDPRGDRDKPYRMRSPHSVMTGIVGHHLNTKYFTLYPTGLLMLLTGFRWDGGTNAVDDHAMIAASGPHDVICDLTVSGVIPYKWRKVGDALLRDHLKFYTLELLSDEPWWFRTLVAQWRWPRWAAVRMNSIRVGWKLAHG